MTDSGARALAAIEQSGLDFVRAQHGPAASLEESAHVRGISPAAIVKTLVVRTGEGQFVFVLVPGDRQISWPALRSLLGVNRVSLPDKEVALQVTGYERGTITPFGSREELPVIADERVARGTVSIGGGAHGVAFSVSGADLVRVLDARIADVTRPANGPRSPS